jgi:NAD(P)-dependent dehydrogenase (short-subunit alcohol dehydrogenase family)
MQKRILIYGGSRGIGAALARRLHAAGHQLHLVGRDEAALAAVAAETGASFTAGNVEDPALFGRVAEAFAGPIDGLAYCPGTLNLRALQRLTPADFERDFRIHALGGALAVQAHLSAGSSVVFFSSVAARQGFASHASVAMAKGAIEGLTLSLAAELAPRVRVNAIAPSLTMTPLTAALTSNEKMAEGLAQAHPLQRLGRADDVASLAAFLLGDEASWMTGQIIGVDGGRGSLRTKG